MTKQIVHVRVQFSAKPPIWEVGTNFYLVVDGHWSDLHFVSGPLLCPKAGLPLCQLPDKTRW